MVIAVGMTCVQSEACGRVNWSDALSLVRRLTCRRDGSCVRGVGGSGGVWRKGSRPGGGVVVFVGVEEEDREGSEGSAGDSRGASEVGERMALRGAVGGSYASTVGVRPTLNKKGV